MKTSTDTYRNSFLNKFKVSEEDLHKLVDTALKHGGSYCDLYFEDTSYTDILLRDSSVATGGLCTDYGCGIRVLDGEKTGYAYTESTDMPSLLKAAAAASSIVSSPGADRLPTPGYCGRPNMAASRYRAEADWEADGLSAFAPYLGRLEKAVRGRDSRVRKVVANLATSRSEILMYNSFDQLTWDSRPLASLSVTVVFEQSRDGQVQTETRNCSRSFRMGAEMLSDALLEEITTDLTEGIDERFEAQRPKGGEMPVVMGAGASGILLHEAMGHAFEADFNRKGQSVFSGRIGERICRKGITIVDDGTIRSNRGAVNFDDEGVPGQRTVMVEDGVLTGYLHDRISAGFYGVKPTGNGRRESFRYYPIPRMRATYMENGTGGLTCKELISGVKKGIFVDRFSNGQVKIGEGDFTFFVKSGFLIENGRLTMPVKDINIIGNGPEALADISAVASDLRVDNGAWTCGKGQSVPVSCGIPSVLIDNLTVGGQ